jgi:hypothetical protein
LGGRGTDSTRLVIVGLLIIEPIRMSKLRFESLRINLNRPP